MKASVVFWGNSPPPQHQSTLSCCRSAEGEFLQSPCFSLPLDPLQVFSTVIMSQSHDASRKWTLQHLTQFCHANGLCLLAFSAYSRGQTMVPEETTVI